MQWFVLAVVVLTGLFVIYLGFSETEELLRVLAFTGGLFLIEHLLVKPLCCHLVSFLWARSHLGSLPKEERRDFVLEFIQQQDHIAEVYGSTLEEMNEELIRNRLLKMEKYNKANGLFTIKENEEASVVEEKNLTDNDQNNQHNLSMAIMDL